MKQYQESTKTKINIYKNLNSVLTKPGYYEFEIVERKFRGHPDSLADMVAQRFSQLYIQQTWNLFPELSKKTFPNFSADKVTLSGACTKYFNKNYEVIKPINALLIGKITKSIGDVPIDIDSIFENGVNDILSKALGHSEFAPYVKREIYAATLAGTDHDSAFYNPKSTKELVKIICNETFANDTIYVVAYAPYSSTEKLTITLDNITDSEEFKKLFPEIGSDIKVMIRRRKRCFDITICLPIFPEKVDNFSAYDAIVKNATDYLIEKIKIFLKEMFEDNLPINVILWTNTKDTSIKKYFAVWGTALSKGDIGVVGRGNRHQGFISGMRPSTNEAVSGKNPNHFAGIIYQLVADDIAYKIYTRFRVPNAVYITANNGDELDKPNSVDILMDAKDKIVKKGVTDVINDALNRIDIYRLNFITGDVYKNFMLPLNSTL